MANIVLTTGCNLHCPYCFADSFVDSSMDNAGITISWGAFHEAKKFILEGTDSASATVGLIGGEPTLHPDFAGMALDLCADERTAVVLVYTNGILLDQFPDVSAHEKTRFLVNCNSPETTGKNIFQTMARNVKQIAELYPEKLSLGVNLYEDRDDYSYILDLLQQTRRERLRVSITVPNSRFRREPMAYFTRMKPVAARLFQQLSEIGVVPYFDCNHLPPCFIQQEDFSAFGIGDGMELLLLDTLSSSVGCSPVIDIFPDLTAVRCLGMSENTRVRIADFANLADLRHYYLREVDAFAYNCYGNIRCRDCYKRKTAKCAGGCMSYKSEHIAALQNAFEEIGRSVIE